MNRYIARKNGKTHYDGKPCKNGHTLKRVKDRNCLMCDRERQRKKYTKAGVLKWPPY